MNRSIPAFELSLTQRDIYFDQLHRHGSPLYNIGGYIQCGAVDVARMGVAHQQVVLAHDAFGVRIVDENGGVQQYISPQRSTELPLLDFSNDQAPQASARQWMATFFASPIAYIDAELCFTYLVKLAPDCYWYVGLAHHLAMDGWGFANWANQLADGYNGITTPAKNALSWSTVVEKGQQYLNSNTYQKDRDFWLNHCDQLPEKLLTAQYLSRFDAHQQIPSRRHVVHLPRTFCQQLTRLADSEKVGLPQVFLAMLATYFSQAYERPKVSLGTVAHNRKNFAEKKMIGVFSGVSPLLLAVDADQSFQDLLRVVSAQQKVNFRHQRFPITDLVQELGLSGKNQPIFEVIFNYLKPNYGALAFDEADAQVFYASHNFNQTPLTVTLWDGDAQTVELQLDYNLAYFTAPEIEQLAARFEHLLEQIVQQHI
ncbi:MAG: condensation domain-containing protein, partial [Psychrosphaera sp.]|nr:condensation domain-containing protein [Psychrosphaera sp.]